MGKRRSQVATQAAAEGSTLERSHMRAQANKAKNALLADLRQMSSVERLLAIRKILRGLKALQASGRRAEYYVQFSIVTDVMAQGGFLIELQNATSQLEADELRGRRR